MFSALLEDIYVESERAIIAKSACTHKEFTLHWIFQNTHRNNTTFKVDQKSLSKLSW